MRWYHYFNKEGEENLVDAISITSEDENLIDKEKLIEEENLLICQQLCSRRYTLFRNFAEFSKYFNSCQEEERCFYEMMREEDGRKPYFDIDIDDVTFNYHSMIEEIKNVLIKMIGDKIKILVFESSTEKKLSFHIVVDGVYLQSYKELLVFFDKVREKLKEEYHQYIDRSVYKSVQQFRIVGSHKYMKTNTKKLRDYLSYKFSIPKKYSKTEISKFNFILASSLVTNISSCRVLCGFQPVAIENNILGQGNATEGDLEDVMKLVYKKYSYGDFQFQECKEKNGNLLIVLKRLNCAYCEICKRYHENENPYVTVIGDYRNVTMFCRRKENKENKEGESLGYLGIPDYTEIMKMEPPIISEMLKTEESVGKETQVIEQVIEEENLEEILEDISSTVTTIYTPKRKPDYSSVLDGINFSVNVK